MGCTMPPMESRKPQGPLRETLREGIPIPVSELIMDGG